MSFDNINDCDLSNRFTGRGWVTRLIDTMPHRNVEINLVFVSITGDFMAGYLLTLIILFWDHHCALYVMKINDSTLISKYGFNAKELKKAQKRLNKLKLLLIKEHMDTSSDGTIEPTTIYSLGIDYIDFIRKVCRDAGFLGGRNHE